MKKRQAKTVWLRMLLGLLCLCMLLPAATSCANPPEFSEISDRFRELVEGSYEINAIFYGVGLPTYERVTDPRETTEAFEKEETGEIYQYYQYEDKTYGKVLAYRLSYDNTLYIDPESGIKYYYYNIYDEEYGKIIVAKSLSPKGQYYLQLADAPKEGVTPDYVNESRGEWGYLLKDFTFNRDYDEKYTYLQVTKTPLDGGEPIYADAKEGIYCYRLPEDYREPIFESYYTATDPELYDYVRTDAKYHSINEIKAAAEKVYSAAYLGSIYDTMFVGIAGADGNPGGGLSARYMEYTDDVGNTSLMKSNVYKPLIKETRQYHFETAKLIRPSSAEFVTVSVDSYLPSKPNEILNVTVTMVKQDGIWMLDCATY